MDDHPFTFVAPDVAAATAERRRAPARRRGRAGLLVLAILAALGLGVALGDALGDRPGPALPVTVGQDVRLVTVTQTVASVTRTVVVTG